MFFSKALLIPPNTPILAPVSETIKVTEGVVRHVWVRWRWGTGNLCGVRMTHNEFQFWPLSLGTWFPSSEYPIDFADSIPIQDDSRSIVVSGYNLDDTFPHTVWVGFNIVREHVTAELLGFLADLGMG